MNRSLNTYCNFMLERKKRRAAEPSLIPSEYEEVQCLISSGNQRINTGWSAAGYAQDTIQIHAKFSVIGNQSQVAVLGNAWNTWAILWQIEGTTIEFFWGDWPYIGATLPLGTIYDVVYSQRKVKVNGTVINKSSDRGDLRTFGDVHVFECAGHYSKIQLYYLKIYASTTAGVQGNEIRNMIPVVRKSDNKPGLYDTTSKTFFTNMNSGVDFTYESL